jgi:hypothetical protein
MGGDAMEGVEEGGDGGGGAGTGVGAGSRPMLAVSGCEEGEVSQPQQQQQQQQLGAEGMNVGEAAAEMREQGGVAGDEAAGKSQEAGSLPVYQEKEDNFAMPPPSSVVPHRLPASPPAAAQHSAEHDTPAKMFQATQVCAGGSCPLQAVTYIAGFYVQRLKTYSFLDRVYKCDSNCHQSASVRIRCVFVGTLTDDGVG